jgi:hypothetical protein
MRVDQPVVRDMPQPKMERHRRILQVLVEAAVGLYQHILHNVARVDPALHHPVHPQVDHPPQRLAVPIQELVDGGRLTGACAGE